MKSYCEIIDVVGRQILDSRGFPTIETDVYVENGFGRASIPSGASTGSREALELRDNDTSYMGKSVNKAISNVLNIIKPELIGKDLTQEELDSFLIKLDNTPNKSNLGANAILSVSLAYLKACSNSKNLPLYKYLGKTYSLPRCMMNILNGGKHAENNINIQEFMIMPIGASSFKEAVQMGAEVYHNLKSILKAKGYSVGVGDEGGFAPNLPSEEEAIETIIEAIKKAGFRPKEDIAIALDVASTEMYDEAKKIGKEGCYYFWKTEELKTEDEMIEYLEDLANKYPIISIEDGLAEEDWEGWRKLTEKLGNKLQLVGDDLFVTNIKRLQKGLDNKIANSILIKPIK